MDHGGPVIRCRTASELRGESDLGDLQDVLLSSGLVGRWLGLLQPRFRKGEIHGAKPENYENAMGKLYEFGLRRGMPVFDERVEPYFGLLGELVEKMDAGESPYSWSYLTMIAAFLSMTGYSREEAVDSVVQHRLETIHKYAAEGDLSEVYVSPDSVGSIPRSFRGRPILNPELYVDDESVLPSIYDIYGILHSEAVMGDPTARRKAEEIIGFVLSPEYQRLYPGYGVLYELNPRRFYAAGWSLHLFGYFDEHPHEGAMGRSICLDRGNLLRLSLLSRSETARGHPWFKGAMEGLERYRISDGVYSFPREMMPERGSGYWVSGRRMGLEENRRSGRAVAIESTFRHLEITSHL
jgi:hypothetical protein